MIPEIEKYRAEIFKIAGFALMTPFGRLFLQPLEIFKDYGLVGLIAYAILCSGLFVFGLTLILKGFDVLDFERRK